MVDLFEPQSRRKEAAMISAPWRHPATFQQNDAPLVNCLFLPQS